MQKINQFSLRKCFYLISFSCIVNTSEGMNSEERDEFSGANKKMCIEYVKDKEPNIMERQIKNETLFRSYHTKDNPLSLSNIWDVKSAKIEEERGAKTIATSSFSIAKSRGFEDGEKIPFEEVIRIAIEIVNAVNLPVTWDFEAGYASTLPELSRNSKKIIETGVIGVNFEDQIMQGDGLYSISEQKERIKTIREAASELNKPLFINARCDLFFKSDSKNDNLTLEKAVERAMAYKEAGADCFFVPGLSDQDIIRELCSRSPLPVNIMVKNSDEASGFKDLGVSRFSYGPFPYIISEENASKEVNADT